MKHSLDLLCILADTKKKSKNRQIKQTLPNQSIQLHKRIDKKFAMLVFGGNTETETDRQRQK